MLKKRLPILLAIGLGLSLSSAMQAGCDETERYELKRFLESSFKFENDADSIALSAIREFRKDEDRDIRAQHINLESNEYKELVKAINKIKSFRDANFSILNLSRATKASCAVCSIVSAGFCFARWKEFPLLLISGGIASVMNAFYFLNNIRTERLKKQKEYDSYIDELLPAIVKVPLKDSIEKQSLEERLEWI